MGSGSPVAASPTLSRKQTTFSAVPLHEDLLCLPHGTSVGMGVPRFLHRLSRLLFHNA